METKNHTEENAVTSAATLDPQTLSWETITGGVGADAKNTEIHIPDSVRIISGWAFLDKQTVVLPKHLESMDPTYLPARLVVYDSCGINMLKCFKDFHLQGDPGRGERIIEVRSASTDQVLYSVYWNEGDYCWHGAYRGMINAAWKSLSDFDYEVYDDFFKEIKTSKLKEAHALFRLKNPYTLSDVHRKVYVNYLKKNAQNVLHRFITEKDLASLQFVAELGVLDKAEVLEDAILFAQKEGKDLAISVFLTKWKRDHSGPNPRPTKARPIVGSVIEMGRDPVSKKGVQWIIIEQTKDKDFLLSLEILARRPYYCGKSIGRAAKEVTWEGSELRQWLNGEFVDSCFSKQEKVLIEPVSRQSKVAGKTTDLVFILGEKEFIRLVAKNATIIKKLHSKGETEFLRDVIQGGRCVESRRLKEDGDYCCLNSKSSETSDGVRPAMWVKR